MLWKAGYKIGKDVWLITYYQSESFKNILIFKKFYGIIFISNKLKILRGGEVSLTRQFHYLEITGAEPVLAPKDIQDAYWKFLVSRKENVPCPISVLVMAGVEE